MSSRFCFPIAILAVPLVVAATAAQGAAIRKLMERVDSASAALGTLAYDARYTQMPPGRNRTIRYAARVQAHRMPEAVDNIGARLRIDMAIDGTSYTYVFDGASTARHNHTQSVSMIGDSASRAFMFISGGVPRNVLSATLVSGAPMAGIVDVAIASDYMGHVTAAGERCVRVRFRYRDDEATTSNTRIYDIGLRDFLPRREIEEYVFDGRRCRNELLVRNLQVNPPLADTLFAVRPMPQYRVEYYSAETPAPLLAVGSAAPDWQLVSGDGATHALHEYRGRIVLMDFWYSTCGPCLKAMPQVEQTHRRFQESGVVVLGINASEPGNDPAGFQRRRGITYPTMLHGDSVAADYHVAGYPVFYIIGRDGTVLYAESGYRDDLAEHLADLLNGIRHDSK
ncbi:MAG: TlpA family protein disulfide reductase [Bacteroidetes bacterium]|nr:TlpA family protein disulfide reductase [Bacteroidota bacterium]